MLLVVSDCHETFITMTSVPRSTNDFSTTEYEALLSTNNIAIGTTPKEINVSLHARLTECRSVFRRDMPRADSRTEILQLTTNVHYLLAQ
jgi:hypothetical protein